MDPPARHGVPVIVMVPDRLAPLCVQLRVNVPVEWSGTRLAQVPDQVPESPDCLGGGVVAAGGVPVAAGGVVAPPAAVCGFLLPKQLLVASRLAATATAANARRVSMVMICPSLTGWRWGMP